MNNVHVFKKGIAWGVRLEAAERCYRVCKQKNVAVIAGFELSLLKTAERLYIHLPNAQVETCITFCYNEKSLIGWCSDE